MEKERKIAAPEGCEIEKVELIDGVAVVTFREKERKPPKSWEEFCEMFPIKKGEAFIDQDDQIQEFDCNFVEGRSIYDTTILPDLATAELRDEFLRYFRPLIEKLKPLYGIKEGGEE